MLSLQQIEAIAADCAGPSRPGYDCDANDAGVIVIRPLWGARFPVRLVVSDLTDAQAEAAIRAVCLGA